MTGLMSEMSSVVQLAITLFNLSFEDLKGKDLVGIVVLHTRKG